MVSRKKTDFRERESGRSCWRSNKKRELPLLVVIVAEKPASERACSRQKNVVMFDFSKRLKTRVPPCG